MGGGRAGTGVAAMDGGVLVPAHTKDSLDELQRRSRAEINIQNGIYLLHESGFLFLFFLQLSSFETNANYANGPVMTTLPV